MRSVVPSESETVPLPDQTPSKPVNGRGSACPADTDNISATATAAAWIVPPNKPEPNRSILSFPFKYGVRECALMVLHRGLVSPLAALVQMMDRRPGRNLIPRPPATDLHQPSQNPRAKSGGAHFSLAKPTKLRISCSSRPSAWSSRETDPPKMPFDT